MKYTNRFSAVRVGYSALMGAVFIIANTIMCLSSSVLLDKYICIIAVNICFFLLFLLLIIRRRLEGKLPEANYVSYSKIVAMVLLDWIIVFLYSAFAPDFFAPYIIIPMITGLVLDDGLSNALSIYLVIIASLCFDYNIYMVLCYIIMVAFGGVLSNYMKARESIEKFYGLILTFSITTLLSIIFYYFSYLELSLSVFVFGLIEGVVASIIPFIAIPLFTRVIEKEQTQCYDEFLNPDFYLCQEIRKFSFIEYQHANRVSYLSRKCAEAINVNAELASCAGLYYRLGKIEGEPMIDNALKMANDYCFPNDVIQILAEYGGIVYLPSSKESAIVHMVDSVVTKVELFDKDSMSSAWNQNMVIYQTINELSQKGYYDNSGLTMNQFLIIREILANEDILA